MTQEFYNRLFDFYASVQEGQTDYMSPLWRGFFEHQHYELHSALMARDAARLTQIFASGTHCAFGFEGTKFTLDEPLTSRELFEVALSLGLPLHDSPIRQLREIEDFLRTPGKVPVSWIWPADAICAYKYPTAAYLVGNTIRFLGRVPERVLEIGPGFGLAGIMLKHLGCYQYDAIDLPIGCIICAWAMAQALGGNTISLGGDAPGARLNLYAPSQIEMLYPGGHEVILNSDSFPEIPVKTQDKYATLMHHLINPFHGFVVSLNTESQHIPQRPIHEAVAPFFRCALRVRFALRQGYLHEVFVKA